MLPIRLDNDINETAKTGNIGSILLDSGKISPDDMTRIIALQGEEGILFGEAAVSLGLLSKEDITWALASQYSYPYVNGNGTAFSSEVVAVHQPFSPPVESFRSIRSGLFLRGAGEHIKTIAVISPDVGDGRTFIASNLASVFAQLGSKTLLIDLNFRTPRIHELFNIKNNYGMSSLIIKRATLLQAVNPTPLAGLYIIPSGPKPPNPVELLAWSDTRGLMTALRENYDIIIIDTPSFNNISDALLIGRLSDFALLLALKGETTVDSFGMLKKHLDNSGVKIIGSVINEVNGKRRKI